MKFRKKPVVIEAVQWHPGVLPDVVVKRQMTENGFVPGRYDIWEGPVPYAIETLEGWMIVREGDWIITGVKGEMYPCKSDIFEMTYEAVDES